MLSVFAGQAKVFGQTQVSAKVDRSNIVIGDQFYLTIEASSNNLQLKWPALPALQGLEIVDTGRIDSAKNGDGLVLRQRLTLTGFDSGAYVIPPLVFNSSTGQPVLTDSIVITVQTIAVDTTKPIKPIKDIIAVKKLWWEYWPWFLAVLAAVALGFLIYYLLKKRKKEKEAETTRMPPERAHEKALRRLMELSRSSYLKEGKIKEYYTDLSNVLRDYLDERFGIPAPELTTDQLLKIAKQQTFLRKIRPELKEVFRTADLAKFAKASPSEEEHQQCLDAATRAVNRTKMQPQEGPVS